MVRTSVFGMESTWETRELPLLAAAVEWFDDPDANIMNMPDIIERSGLSEDDVKRALRRLDSATPPYFEGVETAEFIYPVALSRVTERALREVGAWPTPESLADRIVSELNRAADEEDDPEKQGRIRRLAAWFGGAGRDVLVEVVGVSVARSTGMIG